MNVKRGDVVLVDYPCASGSRGKVRPAIVVQNDLDNQRLTNTILVQVTSLTRRANLPTQVLVTSSTHDFDSTGLRQDSVVNCVNLLTLSKTKVLRRIGRIPNSMQAEVDQGLSAALDLK